MATFKVILEYDGTNYAGWQRQLGHPTIQAAVSVPAERTPAFMLSAKWRASTLKNP